MKMLSLHSFFILSVLTLRAGLAFQIPKSSIHWQRSSLSSAETNRFSPTTSKFTKRNSQATSLQAIPIESLAEFNVVPPTPQSQSMGFNSADLWAVRITSAILTYVAGVLYVDRPQGGLAVDPNLLKVATSNVPGAGLGLYVTETLPAGTLLGTYPGVVVPLSQNLGKVGRHPQCEAYVWRFSDNQRIIDPTDANGICQEVCLGGSDGMPLSNLLFQTIGRALIQPVPTTLCRINEPPKGMDVNVVTNEDIETRSVAFVLERDVYAGEELFIDYGLTYDRSRYQ